VQFEVQKLSVSSSTFSQLIKIKSKVKMAIKFFIVYLELVSCS